MGGLRFEEVAKGGTEGRRSEEEGQRERERREQRGGKRSCMMVEQRVVAFSSPFGYSALSGRIGGHAALSARVLKAKVVSRTWVCFEGTPPSPPGGYYNSNEWNDFRDDGGDDSIKFTWNLLALYGQAVSKRPLTTKMIVSAVLTFGADVVAQYLEWRNHGGKYFDLDWRRTMSITTWFTIVGTPILHKWFGVLERFFPGNSKFNPLRMMLVDQTTFAVFFNSVLLWGINFLESFKPKEAYKQVTTSLPSILVANWKLWPIAQLINFSFIPVQFRVLWTNVIAFAWTIILSQMSHA
eukprot:Plantae.Rhodophyta-Purpureofilum_apyrenoidigerum.ctg3830.p1 GENE.Plantae.Rhodophyta-Purpureofilum_apyrenoidigerum.ctg3830~~Plantae.Rhodophyta-Purpureofilum_apyrenoidigerum.ctg3830.p1  ORF type:complete len:296 (+),score=37.94 Plantae.Rhodophyta-Purpureofilum_apyrenoidigerum.ctg3830:56-943(+)